MLLDQFEQCRAALADDHERVTLLDGKDHDAVTALREMASSLVKVAYEIEAMTAMPRR